MAYRSVQVLLAQDDHQGARTHYAIELAQALDAHLIGVAPTGLVDMPAVPGGASGLQQWAEHAWQLMRLHANQSVEKFRRACALAGLASHESMVVEDDRASALIQYSNSCDLTILSQADPGSPDYASSRSLLEQVVMSSARPTIVLPYAGRFKPPGSTAMIAWDESREAARAIADALPLLARMHLTHVTMWRPRRHADDEALSERLGALTRWMLRHGVQAEVRIEISDQPVADCMLSRVSDLGAELLVMGAYGHARWVQRMLGGATRGILDSMTVPVLMSR